MIESNMINTYNSAKKKKEKKKNKLYINEQEMEIGYY